MKLVVTLVVLVAAEQCLNRVKDFSAPYADPSARSLGVNQRSCVKSRDTSEKLGNDTDRRAGQYKGGGGGRGKKEESPFPNVQKRWHLSSQENVMCDETCFPGSG